MGVGVAGLALTAWLLFVVVDHARQPVYDLPGFAVALGVAGALAAAAGFALVVRRRDGIVLAAALTTLLLFGAVLTLFSIGILLLIAFAISCIAVARSALRREHPVPVGAALAAAVLVGLGVTAAALVAGSARAVTCLTGGASTSSSIFRSASGGSSGSSMSVSGSAANASEGESTIGSRRYRYRCEGDRLVEFEADDLSSTGRGAP